MPDVPVASGRFQGARRSQVSPRPLPHSSSWPRGLPPCGRAAFCLSRSPADGRSGRSHLWAARRRPPRRSECRLSCGQTLAVRRPTAPARRPAAPMARAAIRASHRFLLRFFWGIRSPPCSPTDRLRILLERTHILELAQTLPRAVLWDCSQVSQPVGGASASSLGKGGGRGRLVLHAAPSTL